MASPPRYQVERVGPQRPEPGCPWGSGPVWRVVVWAPDGLSILGVAEHRRRAVVLGWLGAAHPDAVPAVDERG